MKPDSGSKSKQSLLTRYGIFRHSIYGRVVLIITVLSVFLFFSYGVIFRSVYERYLNTVIIQSGNSVGTLIEGALYHSMLENDKHSLQNTLDVIHTMPNIDIVNLYDEDYNLVYSTFANDSIEQTNANCKNCHNNLKTLFPETEKSYKIITAHSECKMNNTTHGKRHLLISSPIINSASCYQSSCHAHDPSDKVLGSLIIKVPLTELDSAMKMSSMKFYLFATFITLLISWLLILFTRRGIKKPLTELLNASIAVAKGDLNTRLNIKPGQLDDMLVVSNAFNHMLDNLQKASTELENWSQQLEYKVQKKSEELGAAQNELIHIERLASLGKLSSSVAHEINNPLSGILVYSKLVQKQLINENIPQEKKDAIIKQLKQIENETKRCGDIVKGLLDFSKKDQEDFEHRHLHEILIETCDLMEHPIKIADISFVKEFTANSDLVFCSPNQIKQACMAILVNATEAITENGEIIVKTYNPSGDSIMIEISDNGIGIAPEDIKNIFEPFFSTKHEAHGIGLGLAIAHGIIQNHHGNIHVKSEQRNGTTMIITLPIIRN